MFRQLCDYFLTEVQVDGYLYVPFKKDELSEEVLKDIKEFKSLSASKYKNKKFVIVFHGETDLSTLPPKTKIYILGHGANISPNQRHDSAIDKVNVSYDEIKHLPVPEWAYAIYGGKKAISIDTVAERMIKDGLLKTNNIIIKLWFCDPNNRAFAIAKRFIQNFEAYPNIFRVDFYFNRILYSPTIWSGEMHKWARNEKTDELTRASEIKESLFSGKNQKTKSNEDEINQADQSNKNTKGWVDKV